MIWAGLVQQEFELRAEEPEADAEQSAFLYEKVDKSTATYLLTP
jgi:hypothetical protein